jgi:hypothetical protein
MGGHSIAILVKNFSSIPVHSQNALLQFVPITPVHTSVIRSRLSSLNVGPHVYSFWARENTLPVAASTITNDAHSVPHPMMMTV